MNSKDWIKVGQEIARDKNAQIPCPDCNQANFSAIEAPWGEDRVEIWIQCPKCLVICTLFKSTNPDT
jgi:hypothetical protein